MSKFNVVKQPSRPDTINLAGGLAFAQSPEMALVGILFTSFVEDQFYRSADKTLEELRAIAQNVNPLFAAKAAVFARTEMGMRSITHALAVYLSPALSGKSYARYFYDKIVYRPDDMTEIIALYQEVFPDRKLPSAMKKGFAQALRRFDEYQLAKYRGKKNKVSLVDVVNLVRPVPTQAIQELVAGNLRNVDTWEARISAVGQLDVDEDGRKRLLRGAWMDLIESRKLGYFALLRNLRNIANLNDDVLVKMAAKMLVDQTLIQKSLVMPFRFATAWDEISASKISPVAHRTLDTALSEAMNISLLNVPTLPGETLIAIDASGSMFPLSTFYNSPHKDGLFSSPIGKAAVFAAALYMKNISRLLMFSEKHEVLKTSPTGNIVNIINDIIKTAKIKFGGGTDFRPIFKQERFDRIIILSDMQAWIGRGSPMKEYREYKERHDVDPLVYSFDLRGYGSLSLPAKNVYQLAGLNDKIFQVMSVIENDEDALFDAIDAVDLMR